MQLTTNTKHHSFPESCLMSLFYPPSVQKETTLVIPIPIDKICLFLNFMQIELYNIYFCVQLIVLNIMFMRFMHL